ncbi:23S rRNA (pseudouridine(1915)-N(3))-methyltransferase RlmH [Jannaschia aquimarina]|uniref:Ribosomal RNA large subunit methyltransferase H n=1 Tax=Jannaschia aquimarina TaxID=935700 RepID=A0A0D1EKT3_9RHOB|nr:23S rRNA (pseudouridine(1915)-N(3))-methyltransferase RlmH [Jannaschia aquimarina]KIT16340.1 Ribosomal RNA large subunit methyltransferase H [Jannaschia aquimarina]SNT25929.1 23S rRNA (pseudouridine1915-N3)-methyltransferase [Jannaschia aquimarina]
MRLTLLAVGRLRRGPEKELIDDYLSRFAKAGRGLGLPAVDLVEVEGRPSEADALSRAIPDGSALAILDERGTQMTSPDFADLLARHRDQARDLCLVIGGADGLDPAIRARADHAISFGRMVWPHMLARVMLAEQLYRAASILAGSPYHRA